MGKTNILYVFGGEKAQGAEIVITRLIEANAADVNAHLFISPGSFADALVAGNKPYPVTQLADLKKLNRSSTGSLQFYTKAIKNYFSLSWKAYRYIRQHRIQVVHTNTIVPASYLLPLITLSKLLRAPTKFIWSDHDLSYFSGLDHKLSKICLRQYHRTLVVSAAVKQKYGASAKVEVLYNGLDTSVFKPDEDQREVFRSALPFPKDAIIIGMPAVTTPRKGQLSLIKVFDELSKSYPSARLLFAGGFEESTPEYTAEFKAAIAGKEHIYHMGYTDSMAAFYNGCDIIVSNSNKAGSEPLGTTIYEAMACGKLVLAADTGGTREIIDNYTDGFLFEPENNEQLKYKLNEILTQYSGLEAVQKAAVNKAATRFNIDTMRRTYNKIIKAITSL